MWTLNLLNKEHGESDELAAYTYLYEAMRFLDHIGKNQTSDDQHGDCYIPGEALKLGFIPILYISGCMCPTPSWMRWIVTQLNLIGRECLFNGNAFAASLDMLYTFEMNGIIPSLQMELGRYKSPRLRVIPLLVPEFSGRGFIAYFLQPTANGSYQVLGHARWPTSMSGAMGNMSAEFYSQNLLEELSRDNAREWLASRPAVIEWKDLLRSSVFNLDLALCDHLSGVDLPDRPLET
jgi:hypothetical protein